MLKFSINLKLLRNKNGLTQKQIADLLNITERQYQRYEAGTVDPPTSKIIKLANFFDVSLGYLTGHANSPKINSYIDVMNVLFELENNFELCLNELNGKITFNFNDNTITHYLDFWHKEKSLYEKGDISKEEYEYWKANFQEQIALYYEKRLKDRYEKNKSSKE